MFNNEIRSVIDLLVAFPDEQSCVEHLEKLRWNGRPRSPFDGTSVVYKCKNGRYRCKNTGKYFNVRTGTMFDNTKVSLQKWFLAIYMVTSHKKGISSMQLAKDLHVTQKTAWFILQRIRACFGLDILKPKMVDNTQIDETFVGGKNKNRHYNKKIKYDGTRNFIDKVPVMGLLSYGKVNAFVVQDTTASSLKSVIYSHIPLGTTIVSDDWQSYAGIERDYDHQVVGHARKEYVNACGFTTNSLEGFWGIFKRGIIGIYHVTSRKHLQKYVDEFVFRYNTRQDDGNSRFNLLLSNTGYRLKYKELIV
ncbi:MAG: Transposase family [Bacteroidetes bacterium]|jgi:hypothetical protein|nr:Transposase family [Bacteroidota bacterium]